MIGPVGEISLADAVTPFMIVTEAANFIATTTVEKQRIGTTPKEKQSCQEGRSPDSAAGALRRRRRSQK
jgi:hypothetical protein